MNRVLHKDAAFAYWEATKPADCSCRRQTEDPTLWRAWLRKANEQMQPALSGPFG